MHIVLNSDDESRCAFTKHAVLPAKNSYFRYDLCEKYQAFTFFFDLLNK